jgi:hypothetical protein
LNGGVEKRVGLKGKARPYKGKRNGDGEEKKEGSLTLRGGFGMTA